jgi:hypothetical protein
MPRRLDTAAQLRLSTEQAKAVAPGERDIGLGYSHGLALDSLDTLEWSGQVAEGAFVLGAEVISCIRVGCEADRTSRSFCA